MSTYIIAECGQNHNGSMSEAKKLIDMAAMPIEFEGEKLEGVNAVKFVVRDLEHECSPEQWNAPYENEHSYGKTYGEHREFLEFGYDEIKCLQEYAHQKGLDFILAICQHTIVDKFAPLCDKIKIASRDLNNVPLLRKLAETGKEIILSSGMSSVTQVLKAYDELNKTAHNYIHVMHCISEYPTKYRNVEIDRINKLKDCEFSGWVGYSDHTTGILAPVLAVSQGARIIEKHITLDRTGKGSDHKGSLEPAGLYRMVRDIRNTEKMLYGIPEYNHLDNARKKLRRSLAVNRDVEQGELLSRYDFIMVSPGTGKEWDPLVDNGVMYASRSYKKNELL